MIGRFARQASKHQLKATFATQELSIRDALRSAMREEMERDEKVFLMGEEVGVYQGAYKVSGDLHQQFGDARVLDTPITEHGFTGIAVGASMAGLRPILEYMTWNFALQAVDQIVNSCAKGRYMSAGDLKCPIVFRGLNGPAAAVAAQHSQCFAQMYANIPGLRVVSVYDSEDARGMLKSAIRDPNPVIFLENELMYGKSFQVTDEMMDPEYLVSLDKAKVMREGTDVTITAFSRMVGLALEAAEELEKQGISAEVINLRTIKPLDRATIIQSVRKTHRLVSVEDGYPQHGVGAEIMAMAFESLFDELDAPVERVSAWDIPLPYARHLEYASLPQRDNIIQAAAKTYEGN